MTYDVVLVCYNGAKWLAPCVAALSRLQCDLSRLNLIFVDNASTDDSLQQLQALQQQYPQFGGFRAVSAGKNGGFGTGCNFGAKLGSAPWVFLLNLDTEICPGCITALDEAIAKAGEKDAAFECRQLPYETGHEIDPVTLEVPWASGAAVAIRREVYEQLGGFDENLFMYCEDVDLSWRIRAAGYTIRYVPAAQVVHHSNPDGSAGPKLGEYAGSFYGNLLLRYKYGGLRTIWRGHKMYLGALYRPLHFDGVRRVLAKNYLRHFAKLWPFLFWRFSHAEQFRAGTARFEGGFSADRSQQKQLPVQGQPLVSVLIRTCGRPQVLRCTLQSLRHQTYKNFEVCIVEDGPETARTMLETEFADLNIRYNPTGQKVGRGKAGNLAMQMAQGQYLNFLDDDDYFYPDHLEMMLGVLTAHPEAQIALGSSMACYMNKLSDEPYRFETVRLEPMIFDRIDLFTMCSNCRIAIQTVMFKKELFTRYGGMREDIGGNEDWAMWLKFIGHGARISSREPDVRRATSVFLVPADPAAAKKREDAYRVYRPQMYDDPDLTFTVTAQQMNGYYQDLLRDMACLVQQGKLQQYLDENLPH